MWLSTRKLLNLHSQRSLAGMRANGSVSLMPSYLHLYFFSRSKWSRRKICIHRSNFYRWKWPVHAIDVYSFCHIDPGHKITKDNFRWTTHFVIEKESKKTNERFGSHFHLECKSLGNMHWRFLLKRSEHSKPGGYFIILIFGQRTVDTPERISPQPDLFNVPLSHKHTANQKEPVLEHEAVVS